MSKSDFSLGVLFGALAGSVVALLYAPEKGKTTRDRLSFRISQTVDELSHLVEKLNNEKEKLESEAKKRGAEVVSEAQEKAENLIKEAEALLHNVSKKEAEAND